MEEKSNILKYKSLGIYTQNENVVYMRQDCHVCISEGFEALTRIRVSNMSTSVIASLHIITSDVLRQGEIGLSQIAAKKLKVSEGETLYVSHLEPIESLSSVRAKIYNQRLDYKAYKDIITDIIEGDYSNIHLSAFITACAGDRMDLDEISDLTKAMITSGKQLDWNKEIVVDKHCIGGLPGNRTTPIVVAIAAAYGLTMPKTSSRAITSPAGTADTMEVLTNVTLSGEEIKRVVEQEGGCLVWGGTAQLSPADDILIKVEKALDIDSEGQLIASVLSKKAAAGSTHVVIDIPVGETAKVRSEEAAQKLKEHMEAVGDAVGLKIKVVITDGSQPVGRGIGPNLEAVDVLSVLQNKEDAPQDLKERAILLAGHLLELSEKVKPEKGLEIAKELLESGKAYQKFEAICTAQGRFSKTYVAPYQFEMHAPKRGTVKKINNRKIAKLAKLSGAPQSKSAGISMNVRLGDELEKGELVYILHAETNGELNYALEYYENHDDIIEIE
ncbi:thymidine phosphorylase family protein [Croceitalea sp. MTPC9]|uniref:thymidine phosphorylase n=1 Tax=Maribacter cobaltidurans TaxID=1178778 RepID=A0ABU7ITP1_9FLAO|nr:MULTISPECIES: thymidine phosphorylase family protein [Maribacter]MDC6388953.1 thymidine phosphorylase family protein [Maribacter sp. PR1]MEE1976341.1 thymidine phosphorylase family protein [Maribacter cobaltidurans]GMN11045.1 thymidine phosphorylase family protein [Croceitalea sp. MTPC6]GMN17314.1 thymidine phosphorylase family protein [Croceitalea sp. MTPC9]